MSQVGTVAMATQAVVGSCSHLLSRGVAESSFSGLHTASGVGVTHTLSGGTSSCLRPSGDPPHLSDVFPVSVSGIYSHTDFITVTADFIGRSTGETSTWTPWQVKGRIYHWTTCFCFFQQIQQELRLTPVSSVMSKRWRCSSVCLSVRNDTEESSGFSVSLCVQVIRRWRITRRWLVSFTFVQLKQMYNKTGQKSFFKAETSKKKFDETSQRLLNHYRLSCIKYLFDLFLVF